MDTKLGMPGNAMPIERQSTESNMVQHVAVKAPLLMDSAVSGWFKMMEAQFILNAISRDSNQFHHIIFALPPEMVARLSCSTLEGESYLALKDEVGGVYEKTKPELIGNRKKYIANVECFGLNAGK